MSVYGQHLGHRRLLQRFQNVHTYDFAHQTLCCFLVFGLLVRPHPGFPLLAQRCQQPLHSAIAILCASGGGVVVHPHMSRSFWIAVFTFCASNPDSFPFANPSRPTGLSCLTNSLGPSRNSSGPNTIDRSPDAKGKMAGTVP